jgi:hypothetical protein
VARSRFAQLDVSRAGERAKRVPQARVQGRRLTFRQASERKLSPSGGLIRHGNECRPYGAGGFTKACWSVIMMRSSFTVAMCATALGVSLAAGEPSHCQNKVSSGAQDVHSAFERLKKLAGDWQIAASADKGAAKSVDVRYRLTAGGSALVETLFPGGEKEMVTVYHPDGDQIALTHYCMAGNQPRMRAKVGTDPDELVFDFADGTNLNPAKDFHMHDCRIRFVDSDHLHTEWEYYKDGKAAGKHAFDLVRVKS